jgi:hypothetical protein
VKASGKAARELGKKTFTLPRGVRPPLAFLLSPRLATNHTRGSLNIYIIYTAPNLFNYRPAPFVPLGLGNRIERNDSVAVDPALSMLEGV